MREIRGKKALITGAASGLGRAIAIRLAREGADVGLLDVNEAGLDETAMLAQSLGVLALSQICDVSQPGQISTAIHKLLASWGNLDILVNNAGVCYYGPTPRMTSGQWDWVLGVNLLAPVQFVHELLPTLLARPEAHIVNMASIYGVVATSRCCAYHVSKFGMVGFSEALRAEFRRTHLGVTAVCPGFVTTNLFNNMVLGQQGKPKRTPPSWLSVTPERIADLTIRAIYRNKRLVLGSAMATILYHAKRFLPGLLDWTQGIGRKRPYKLDPLPAEPIDGVEEGRAA